MGKIDSISRALQTEHGIDLSTGKIVKLNDINMEEKEPLLPVEVNEISSMEVIEKEDDVIKEQNNLDKTEEHIQDETNVKRNLRNLIEKGMDLADDMIETVRISESPKAFEPASIFLKTLVELNESLLDIHDRDRKLKVKSGVKEQNNGSTTNNTQNNTVIYATPMEMLKAKKESKK